MTSITASLVYAGTKWFSPVSIWAITNGSAASGAIGSVRNDATSDYIGCWASVSALVPADPTTGGVPSVYCSAHNNSGTVACASIDAGIVKLAQTITTDSYVRFNLYQNPSNPNDPRNGTCSYLEVQNYSGFAPKLP